MATLQTSADIVEKITRRLSEAGARSARVTIVLQNGEVKLEGDRSRLGLSRIDSALQEQARPEQNSLGHDAWQVEDTIVDIIEEP